MTEKNWDEMGDLETEQWKDELIRNAYIFGVSLDEIMKLVIKGGEQMEFNELMNKILLILDMLDKIYHAVIKEEE